jgi:lactoylglutathione lyase
MRTLHVGLRSADLERSLTFYTNVGYQVVGEVPESDLGHLTMLKLPDDEFATIELVHDPNSAPFSPDTRLSHLVIQVSSMDATLAELAARGIDAEATTSPDGSHDFLTTWVMDPDGNRIELVQWPAGHADGLTAADFKDSNQERGH